MVGALLLSGSISATGQSPTQATNGADAAIKHKWPTDIAEQIDWHEHHDMMSPAHHIMRSLSSSGVELNDDQVERLTAARGQLMAQVIPAKDRLLLLVPDMKDVLSAQSLDDDKIRAVFAKIKVEIDSLYAQAVDHMITAAHVFTPEQRHKLRIAVDRMELGPLGSPHSAPSSLPPSSQPSGSQ
jgi:Spy/CpxP family protein refolding chaperone